MFSKIRIAFYFWLIWIGFFEAARLIFILYNSGQVGHFDPTELSRSFLYGIRMDASMAAYLTIPLCLLMLTGQFIRHFRHSGLYVWYSMLVLIPVLLIVICDLPAYAAWGYRLDATPLKYLSSPREAMASVSHLPWLRFSIAMLLLSWLMWKGFHRFFNHHQPALESRERQRISFILTFFFTAMFILPLRGGWQLAPINQSTVYYSTDNFCNQSAINASWNFFHSLSQDLENKDNPFMYLDEKNASDEMETLFSDTGQTDFLIDSSIRHPNVILIVWESFTKKLTDTSINGVPVTPCFSLLKKEGVFFNQVYASGDRTDKGIVAILSGYPSQPVTSIIKIPQKSSKLPVLPLEFSRQQYQTNFFYGGELEFANMKSYLLHSGFSRFTEKADFDSKDLNSKWGAHDGVVRRRIEKDLAAAKEPFFTTWLTLSSHEPYETPVKPVITGDKDVLMFANSIHYTDREVYDFVKYCEQQPFWKNTLMVIVADHGHRLPYADKKIEDFKIPMLWLGGALVKKDTVIQKVCGQTDIASTLLHQCRMDASAFLWSRNVFSRSFRPWSYFSFNNGFGYVQPEDYLIFDNVGKLPVESSGKPDAASLVSGKALVQKTFADYLSR